MPLDFELKLLTLTQNRERITLRELRDLLQMNPEILAGRLRAMSGRGFLRLSDEAIEMHFTERMLLAEHLIREGHDFQRVSNAFTWQEFENFASLLLRENGYRVIRHLVFKSRMGRREIDLIAWNENSCLLVDCKHWERRLTRSSTEKVAAAQVERARLLAEHPEVLERNGFSKCDGRFVLPILITLVESEQRIVDGVPIVPVLKLQNFLQGFTTIDDSLRLIQLDGQSQTRLG